MGQIITGAFWYVILEYLSIDVYSQDLCSWFTGPVTWKELAITKVDSLSDNIAVRCHYADSLLLFAV